MKRYYIVLTAKGEAKCVFEEFSYDQDALLENEFIIETSMSLISAGTELSRVFAIKEGFSYPVFPGYTAVGRILAKGNGLPSLQIGDRVFYSGVHASINKFTHVGTTQGNKVMKFDERLTDSQACFLQMGLIAMNCITACEGKLNDTVAVYGLGTIGIISCLLFKRAGFRVIGFDPVQERCNEAISVGLEEVVCAIGEEQIKRLNLLTNGKDSDISIDCSGISAAICNAIIGTRKHGQVILLGSPRSSYMTDITPILNAIHMKMLQVKGAFNELNPFREVEGSKRSVEKDFNTIQDLLLDGTIDVNKIISHIIQPEDIMLAYNGLMYDQETWHCVAIDWSKKLGSSD